MNRDPILILLIITMLGFMIWSRTIAAADTSKHYQLFRYDWGSSE